MGIAMTGILILWLAACLVGLYSILPNTIKGSIHKFLDKIENR